MKKSYFWGLLLAIMALIPSQNAFADYCTKSGNSTHDERYLPSFTLTDGANDAVVSNIQTDTKKALYHDKTSVVLETEAGATLSFKELNWIGEWMHGYVFVDYDKNGAFNSTLNADGTTGGELVSYNFYSSTGASPSTNSKGEATQNNCGVKASNMPSWSLPLDLEAGDYRVRFNVAWNSIDPCGYAEMGANGGAMVDVTIRIASKAVARTISVSATPAEAGTVTINGEAVSSVTAEGGITLVATPAEGYKFVNWTVEGVEVSTNATYIDGTDGDKAYVANFVALEVYNIGVSVNDVLMGTAVSTPEGSVYEGTQITLVATPAEGYEFVNWTVDGTEVSDDATFVTTATASTEYVANFNLPPVKLAPVDVFASFTPGSWYPLSYIIDGSYSTESYAQISSGASVTVVLEEETTIGDIVLVFYNYATYQPSKAKIQVSSDNVTYTDVEGTNFTKADISGGYITLDAKGAPAKYVRLFFEETQWFDMYEFEVYEYPVAVPSRAISVSVANSSMGTAYIGIEGTTSVSDQTGAVRLVAVPAEGYVFKNWTVNGVEVSTSATFVDKTEGDKEYVANFAIDPTLSRTDWSIYTVSSAYQGLDGDKYVKGEQAIDNDPTTYWHSDWDDAANQTVPQWIVFDLGSVQKFTSFSYAARTAEARGANGAIKTYKLYVSETAPSLGNLTGSMTEVKSGEFIYPNATHMIDLDSEYSAQYVMLYATSTYGGTEPQDNLFANCAEFYLYYEGTTPAPTPVYAVSVATADEAMGTAEVSATEVEEGEEVTFTATAAEGYQFVNWTSGEEVVSTENPYTTTVTAEMALVANFVAKEFTITYEVDGEVYTTETYAYGATVAAQAEPTKVGYTFSGWSEIPATMPAENVTVTGSFEVNYYNVVYYVDGEFYKTAVYTYGADVTALAEPTKVGYTFSGWSEIPATMPAENVTVTGSFEVNYYDVVYKVDGAVYETVTYAYGADVTALAEPTKPGYTFSGWSAIPETMPAENVEVIGSFSEIIKEDKVIADDNNVEAADAYYANVTVADEKVWTIGNNNIVADKVVVSVDTLGAAPEIVIAENGTVKAALEVKRVVKKGQWALMSFPFVVDLANVTVNSVAAVNNSNIKVMVYDAAKRANESIELWTKSGWVDLQGTTIAANQGFAVAVNAQNGDMQTVTFTAATQTYDGTAKQIALDRHESTVNEGADADWNFYGNPTLAKAQKGFGYALYVYNAEDDSYDEYAADEVATYQPYAAWFVQSAEGFNKMSFDAGQAGALADANGVYGEMQFSLNGEDEARVLLVDEASEEYVRNEDALYFPALNANLSQLYIVKGNIKMAVSEQPALSESMALGYKAAKAGVQTLTLTSMPENANVVLKDNVTGDEVALTVGDSYSFESAAGTFNNRFVVTTTDLTGIAQATANGDVKVVVNGDEIIVYGVEAGVEVAAYATNGVVVASAVATEGATTLATSATGVIVVKVADAAIKVIK